MNTQVDPQGYRALATAFLATRGSANTRAAYARDLLILGMALGVNADGDAGPSFGVEHDPVARCAAQQLAAIPPRLVAAVARRARRSAEQPRTSRGGRTGLLPVVVAFAEPAQPGAGSPPACGGSPHSGASGA